MTKHEIQRLGERLRGSCGDTEVFVAAREAANVLSAMTTDHDARVAELLKENEIFHKRMCAAERQTRAAESALLSLAKVAGDIAAIRMREE